MNSKVFSLCLLEQQMIVKYCVMSLFFSIPQDEKLTVTQAGSVNGAPSVLHFQYQLSEQRFSCWDTVLSDDALYLEIPNGALHNGSREGYAYTRAHRVNNSS